PRRGGWRWDASSVPGVEPVGERHDARLTVAALELPLGLATDLAARAAGLAIGDDEGSADVGAGATRFDREAGHGVTDLGERGETRPVGGADRLETMPAVLGSVRGEQAEEALDVARRVGGAEGG